MFRLLVCGGRDVTDVDFVFRVLDRVRCKINQPLLVIHGDARGADRLAGQWARHVGFHEVKVPALWDIHDKCAGPIRNHAMLWLEPNGAVAFPGGSGTADMVAKCRAARIPVFLPRP